ncbi:UNVERIFIED_CONTAM: hypothetical protein NCL1_54968 [Trichonephila clavipes]
MNVCNLFKGLCFTSFRQFNWKYPYPKELQPSPPEKEVINPENLAQIDNPLSENDKFNNEYINRNPRNLEQMLLEIKPNGFPLDAPDRVFWNKYVSDLKIFTAVSSQLYHNKSITNAGVIIF